MPPPNKADKALASLVKQDLTALKVENDELLQAINDLAAAGEARHAETIKTIIAYTEAARAEAEAAKQNAEAARENTELARTAAENTTTAIAGQITTESAALVAVLTELNGTLATKVRPAVPPNARTTALVELSEAKLALLDELGIDVITVYEPPTS